MNKEAPGSESLFLKEDVWRGSESRAAASSLATRGPIHGSGKARTRPLFSDFGAQERTTLDDLTDSDKNHNNTGEG